MKPTEYDGKFVNYVDPLKIQHKGIVVGASNDGKWTFIQSTNPKVLPADWHFKVISNLVPAILA